MRLRRSALRLLFRTARELGLATDDPTLDVVLPSRTKESARPLTDDEVELCRRVCLADLSTTRLSVAWALGEATARTAEIPHVLIRDLDLDHNRVWLAGSTKTEARWGSLSRWGATQIARHLAALETEPETPLAYPGRGNLESRRSFSCKAIRDTLERAELADDPYVRPAFIDRVGGQGGYASDREDRSCRVRARGSQSRCRGDDDRLGLDEQHRVRRWVGATGPSRRSSASKRS